jgi:hypothetical protein
MHTLKPYHPLQDFFTTLAAIFSIAAIYVGGMPRGSGKLRPPMLIERSIVVLPPPKNAVGAFLNRAAGSILAA